MIQRIQTIYLFVTFLLGMLVYFIPVFELIKSDELPLSNYIGQGVFAFSGLVALINIFLFKNRVLQTNICKLIYLLIIVSMAIFAYTYFSFPIMLAPSAGIALLVLSLVSNFLAQRAIQKDENLVRSTDRLR